MTAYFNYPFGRTESLPEGWIVATYLVTGAGYHNILDKAGGFAVGQSVGTWVPVPGISDTMLKHRQGRVVSLESMPGEDHSPSAFLLRLAFPTENFGGSLAMLLTCLVGNDVSTALAVRLLDLEYPGAAADGYAGPRQGMEELRALAGVSERRPLVLNMIKPCSGFTPREGAKLFYEVAKGGVDMVKDDELLASPSYNQVAERTAAYLRAAEAAGEISGRRTLYLPNISGPPRQMRENAKAVLDAGARACLVNFVFAGPDALRELADEFGDRLFIMGHYAGAGVMDHPRGGIANSVFLGLLPRLAGAHALMTMAPARNNPAAVYDYYRTVQAQRLPIPGLPALITAVGGGITPVNQREIQQELGPDTIIGIGGAIQGHPMGAAEGARAAMEAVCATAQGRDLEDAAQSCPPLAEAIRRWTAL